MTLDALDKDKSWDVEIKEHRRKKTSSQRNWFHKLCEIWGDRIGLTPGQCKDIVKGHYFGWKVVRVAGIDFPIAAGSSEELDRIGYSALIQTLYQLAAESGEALPDPNQGGFS